jgi:hypothetical protein
MSWLSTNYEKAALGGAFAITLGLAYLGYSKLSSVSETFGAALKGQGNNVTAVAGAELIPKAIASIQLNRTWQEADIAGRKVDLFTGIPLFVASADPEKPVDLLDPAATPVHPPIANAWWIQNKIDPGFGDSPNRDPDKDGFSNLEEYNAKTNPNDPNSIPSLIAKLMYVKDETLTWVIIPSYGEGTKFPFKYVDSTRAENKTGSADMIAPDGMFFAKGVMANRFKLLGSEMRKEVNKATNAAVEVTYVKIEDQRPNKLHTVYEVPAPLNVERVNEHRHYDRTAVLSLEALGMNGKTFKVEEFTEFALPQTAAKKDYKVVKITPETVTVEYTDSSGAKKTVEIQKGGMPKPTE